MAKKENRETCKSCLFFVSNENMGVCRRFPVFANHSNNDWCGEWRLEESQALDKMVEEVIKPIEFTFVEAKKPRGRPKKS
jgi:hypothetical protein